MILKTDLCSVFISVAVGECTCFGDPHCSSFDGNYTHGQGQCEYTMVSNTQCQGAAPDTPFSVNMVNWDNEYIGPGDYAWVKEVVVNIYGVVSDDG